MNVLINKVILFGTDLPKPSCYMFWAKMVAHPSSPPQFSLYTNPQTLVNPGRYKNHI